MEKILALLFTKSKRFRMSIISKLLAGGSAALATFLVVWFKTHGVNIDEKELMQFIQHTMEWIVGSVTVIASTYNIGESIRKSDSK